MKIILILLCIIFSSCSSTDKNNMKEYMKTQSLKWEQLPMQWNEGAFLGNGRIGMVAYIDSADNSLTLWLSRPDVTDHRKAPDKKTSMGVKDASVMFDFCRMDIGKMKMYPEAKILSGTMELDIYNAELNGTLKTDKGDINIRAYTPQKYDLNIVEINTDIDYKWKLKPGSPSSPRIQVFPQLQETMNYQDNPNPICNQTEKEGSSVHPLLAGGDYATYWKNIKEGDKDVLFVSTMNEVPKSDVSLIKAEEEVKKAIEEGTESIRKDMYGWWNNYYNTGMISIPDKKMENFYHIQLYKLATCSHPEGPAMDVFGTFYKTSQWPGIWWNLNIQLTYMSTHPTNKMAQAVNYQDLIDNYFIDVMNSRGPAKVGDFAWALHTYVSYMLYEGRTWTYIDERFMPKAEAVLDIYKPHLVNKDGVINLMQTESPEYEGFEVYDNSNYNLAALRWILTTMINIADETGKYADKSAEWKNILTHLHPAPVNENGYMIGSDKPFAKSHRHYSHLLSFYPLKLEDPTKPEVKEVLEKSIDHWMNIGNGSGLAGYSYTGAASLYAYLGNGDKAYDKIYHFLNKPIGISLLLSNTLYVESGGKNPVIETPLSAATAITEMLLQGWGGNIRLFPAIPSAWKDCSFNKLRAEGGFVVSAAKKNGKLDWVTITSEAGRPCKVYLPEWENVVASDSKIKVSSLGHGYYEVSLGKGETVSLSENNNVTPKFDLQLSDSCNFYGVKLGKGLDRQMDWPEDLKARLIEAQKQDPQLLQHK